MILETLSGLFFQIFQRELTRGDLALALKFWSGLRNLPLGLQMSWLLGAVVIFLLYQDYVTAWDAQRLGTLSQVRPLRRLLRGFAIGFALAFLAATLSFEAGLGGLLIYFILSRRYSCAIFSVIFFSALNTCSFFIPKNVSVENENKSWFS